MAFNVYNLSSARIGSRIAAYLTISYVLYAVLHTSVMIIATSGALQEFTPLPTASRKCSPLTSDSVISTDDVTTSASTSLPCDSLSANSKELGDETESQYLFGVNLTNPYLTFSQSLLLAAVVSVLYLPQLYGGIKLTYSTDLRTSPPNSIKLAFIHQKIQIVAISVELIISAFIVNHLDDVLYYQMYGTVLMVIFSKLILHLVVGTFINEQLQHICKQRKVVLLTAPSIFPFSGFLFGLWGARILQTVKVNPGKNEPEPITV